VLNINTIIIANFMAYCLLSLQIPTQRCGPISQGNRSITALQINDLQNPPFYGLKRGFLRLPNKAVNIGSDDAQRVLDNDTLKRHIHAGDLSH
jgi:hypothetical protein